ncbi:DUF6544 family protein [Flavobacterium sp.]|uniref:DUF6544 family protein n=1 Tax=Flavobacterium sp. TaxID=239 RepID=UPI00286D913D|nr:DUF6544 family protein [Flavobacterium sp.]
MKYIFSIILIFHGLIHFMGFAKAFGYGNITQLAKDIPKSIGVFWLITALLFIVATILFFLKNEYWIYFGIIASILSQILIFTVWKEAKLGSIPNLIIIVVAFLSWTTYNFEATFRKDVNKNLQESKSTNTDFLTENDIQSLPKSVQKYLRYCGVMNKPKVKNFRIVFDGEMREKGKDWFKFQSVQYNFFDNPTRLFFMKAKMFGTIVPGYHNYQKAKASMQIKLFGAFPVVDVSGIEMNKAETVTVFNDMCLMAPATLIDKRIQWKTIDNFNVEATFNNEGFVIKAILTFNEKGQLTNFVSDDRYAISDMKRYRFSTPVKDYELFNGIRIMTYGEAIWHYPDGQFVYGKFYLKSIEYNVGEFKK